MSNFPWNCSCIWDSVYMQARVGKFGDRTEGESAQLADKLEHVCSQERESVCSLRRASLSLYFRRPIPLHFGISRYLQPRRASGKRCGTKCMRGPSRQSTTYALIQAAARQWNSLSTLFFSFSARRMTVRNFLFFSFFFQVYDELTIANFFQSYSFDRSVWQSYQRIW